MTFRNNLYRSGSERDERAMYEYCSCRSKGGNQEQDQWKEDTAPQLCSCGYKGGYKGGNGGESSKEESVEYGNLKYEYCSCRSKGGRKTSDGNENRASSVNQYCTSCRKDESEEEVMRRSIENCPCRFKGGSSINKGRKDKTDFSNTRVKGGFGYSLNNYNPEFGFKKDDVTKIEDENGSRSAMSEKEFNRLVKPLLDKYCPLGKVDQEEALLEEIGMSKEKVINTEIYNAYLENITNLEKEKIKLRQTTAVKLLQKGRTDSPKDEPPKSVESEWKGSNENCRNSKDSKESDGQPEFLDSEDNDKQWEEDRKKYLFEMKKSEEEHWKNQFNRKEKLKDIGAMQKEAEQRQMENESRVSSKNDTDEKIFFQGKIYSSEQWEAFKKAQAKKAEYEYRQGQQHKEIKLESSQEQRTEINREKKTKQPPPTYRDVEKEDQHKVIKRENMKSPPELTWMELETMKQQNQKAIEKRLQREAQKHTKDYIECAKKLNARSQDEETPSSPCDLSVQMKDEKISRKKKKELERIEMIDRYCYRVTAENIIRREEAQVLIEKQRAREKAQGKSAYLTSQQRAEILKQKKEALRGNESTLVKYGNRNLRNDKKSRIDKILVTKEVEMFRNMFLLLIVVMLQGAKSLGIV